MNEYANKCEPTIKESEFLMLNDRFKRELEITDKLISQLNGKISAIMFYDEGKANETSLKQEPGDLITKIRISISRLADQNGRLERIISHLTTIVG